eukprot:scaffold15235_cov61-Phaeocystis_antarctica.AAC.1
MTHLPRPLLASGGRGSERGLRGANLAVATALDNDVVRIGLGQHGLPSTQLRPALPAVVVPPHRLALVPDSLARRDGHVRQGLDAHLHAVPFSEAVEQRRVKVDADGCHERAGGVWGCELDTHCSLHTTTAQPLHAADGVDDNFGEDADARHLQHGQASLFPQHSLWLRSHGRAGRACGEVFGRGGGGGGEGMKAQQDIELVVCVPCRVMWV